MNKSTADILADAEGDTLTFLDYPEVIVER